MGRVTPRSCRQPGLQLPTPVVGRCDIPSAFLSLKVEDPKGSEGNGIGLDLLNEPLEAFTVLRATQSGYPEFTYKERFA